MGEFRIVLHGDLSELAQSESVEIDLPKREIYGHDLKDQLAVILAARNPRNAENIRTKIMHGTWRRDREIFPDDARLPQGRYDLSASA